ncbi:MAG: aromatic amino acid lyase, partial [Bacteroidetes bacterium]|nr:aromatic amino acid lyase [Bacteroidota bacterium]
MVNTLTIDEIEKVAFKGKKVVISQQTLDELTKSFRFLVDFSKDKIIYGINTGFGPMVQFKVESHELNQLQYNLIRSHSNGAGNVLNEVYTRAVVLARLNNFLQGHSGISPETITLLTEFLNQNIVPEIFEHGGVGASGDLVQLAHLGLNLIGEGNVYYQGKRENTKAVLDRLQLKPLTLKLRDGLGIINGTSCMTGIAAVNLIYAQRLLNWAVVASAVINEIIESFDDSFSSELNAVKLHKGQQYIASQMRQLLKGSGLVRSRKELFSDQQELSRTEFKNKIQEYYSIRCVPQILGPVYDTCMAAVAVTENELNSTNDNPVVIPEADNVFHGG